ncbi:MAG: hypothetical protein KGL39_54410 [Patescibacteria group bacterium]|nr:hypothetical protein [Patescibacteria group bacterium]
MMAKLDKIKVNIPAGKYLANRAKFSNENIFGIEYIPVDVNRAFVPINKFGTNNLDNTQDNIQDRFGMETPNQPDNE